MAHKPNKADKKRREKYKLQDRYFKNKKRKLDKHIKKQPNDNSAQEARNKL